MRVQGRHLMKWFILVCVLSIATIIMSTKLFLERKQVFNDDPTRKLMVDNRFYLFVDEEILASQTQYSTSSISLLSETSIWSSHVSSPPTYSNIDPSSGNVATKEPIGEGQEPNEAQSKPEELISELDQNSVLNAPIRDARYTWRRRDAPLNHVTFIKTHKSAGSTVQNILMRYGYYHNLTFTLPNGTSHHIGWPRSFVRSMIRPSIKPPDIHCYHSVLSKELLRTMPADAFNLAAVRDPFTQMRSAYVYYSWYKESNKSLSTVLDELLAGPQNQTYFHRAPTYNPIMVDMGMNVSDMAKPAKVEDHIQYLNQTFHLVIVVEHFYESIIIMRDMLGWSNKDVAFFGTNFRKEGKAQPQGVDLNDTSENRAKVYRYLSADTQLYSFFKSKMDKYIENNKEYLDKEVQGLKKYQQSLMNFCIEKSLPSSQIHDKRFKSWGNGAYGYVLTPEGLLNQTCVDMAMAEEPWARRLNSYQPAVPG